LPARISAYAFGVGWQNAGLRHKVRRRNEGADPKGKAREWRAALRSRQGQGRGEKERMTVAARCIDGTFCEVDSSELNFNIAVLGIVVRDGKVLVLPQFDGYDFPGGGVEKGESHLDALVREVREETGFDVVPDGLAGAYTTFFKSHKSGKFFHSVNLFYFTKVIGGKLSADGFTESERKYIKSPQFVDIDYLKLKLFLRYVDGFADLVSAIEKRIGKRPENPARIRSSGNLANVAAPSAARLAKVSVADSQAEGGVRG
jgi:8-oxo-dGTP pyrophosphatase MutT (NUDIX family)